LLSRVTENRLNLAKSTNMDDDQAEEIFKRFTEGAHINLKNSDFARLPKPSEVSNPITTL